MDEEEKKVASEKSPYRALDQIDQTLSSAYPAPEQLKFSENEAEAIVQKAVLYHRIRQDSSLRQGVRTATNDIQYRQLSAAIIEGRDPVAQFIKRKKPAEQTKLLRELMTSDRREAWYEDMLMRSAEKKAQADESDKRQTVPDKMTAELCRAQSNVLAKLAENRNGVPKAFLADSENLAGVRRMLAVMLHQKQVEQQTEELKEAFRYESPESRQQLLEERELFLYEKLAGQDLENHLKRLEARPEVKTVLHRLTKCANMEELGEYIKNPPSPTAKPMHDNLKLMEEKLVPDAIYAFLSSPGAPAEENTLYQILKELNSEDKEKVSDDSTPEECEQRMKEYRAAIKQLENSEWAETAQGRELKAVLNSQTERIRDVALAPERETIQFTFRADTLIDYMDPNDPTHRKMDAMEAREKLLRGVELEQITFADNEFVGTVKKVSYDKKTGKINKGPEKLITRVMDMADQPGKKPELQLEQLRKMKDVLQQSDPFYVKNSESFNNVFKSLNKVIKAQESLDKDANIRQVEELRTLYAELDSNAAKYVKSKEERMKTGDERAQLRMDTVKTLQSLTGEKQVEKLTDSFFTEQKKRSIQQEMAAPCKNIMDKWEKAGTPTTPEQLAEFKKDFNALSTRFNKLKKDFNDLSYLKLDLSGDLEKFTQKAEEVQRTAQPEDQLDAKKLVNMQRFTAESKEAVKKYNAMEGIDPENIKKKGDPEIVREQPQKNKGVPVK